MSQLPENSLQDPYRILEIPYTASEEEIRKAFHKKMTEGGSEVVITAYGKIRDSAGRRNFRWGNIWSIIRDPREDIPDAGPIDIHSIIKELAFQSEWELGDESCLK